MTQQDGNRKDREEGRGGERGEGGSERQISMREPRGRSQGIQKTREHGKARECKDGKGVDCSAATGRE